MALIFTESKNKSTQESSTPLGHFSEFLLSQIIALPKFIEMRMMFEGQQDGDQY